MAVNKEELLFKKVFAGKASTDNSTAYFSETAVTNARLSVFSKDVWSEAHLIPDSGIGDPTSSVAAGGNVEVGVVKYYSASGFTAVAGADAGYSAGIKDWIPFNFGDGTTYNYVLLKNNGDRLFPGAAASNWTFDTEAGVLIFHDGNPDGVSETAPPSMSAYVYTGKKLSEGLTAESIITASIISASGAITASNLSGVNTGDQDLSSYIQASQTSSFVVNSETSSLVKNSETSSFVLNSETSSLVKNSETSSFVVNSETSSFVVNSETSSLVKNSETSSFVLNSSTSSFVVNSETSSLVKNSETSSFVLNSSTSSFVINSETSSLVKNSETSSFVLNSSTSSFVINSETSSLVKNSETSSFVLNSSTSSFVINSETSSLVKNSETSSLVKNSETSSLVKNSETSSLVKNSETSSFVLNSETSSIESNLQTAMTVTLGSNLGGITNGTSFSAGSSIESILRQLLVQYQAPTLNSLTILGLVNILEVGETDTATGGTFTTSSDSNNDPWASLALTLSGVTFNNLVFSGESISFDDVDLRLTSPGSKTFFLNGTDEEGTSTTTSTDRTDSISWRNPIFFGGSRNDGGLDSTEMSDSILDDILSDISGSGTGTGLTESELPSNDDQTLINVSSNTAFPDPLKIILPASVADTSKFTYIIYPETYGELTSILKDDVQVETDSFLLLGTGSHTRHSNTMKYNVYRSAGTNAYSAGSSLTLNDE